MRVPAIAVVRKIDGDGEKLWPHPLADQAGMTGQEVVSNLDHLFGLWRTRLWLVSYRSAWPFDPTERD